MKRILISLFVPLFYISVFAQMGIGTNNPDPSAALDVSATDKGILLNKVDLQSPTDITTIPNPANGLFVYTTADHNLNTDDEIKANSIYYFDGTKWDKLYSEGDLQLEIEKLRVPIFAMSVYSKSNFSLATSGVNDVPFNAGSTDEFFNPTAMERVSPTVFKAKVNGVYMIDGFVNIIQTLTSSQSSSWAIKILRSTDGGITWSANFSKGNRCNHIGTWENQYPETCLLQESAFLNAGDMIKLVTYFNGGDVPTNPILAGTTMPLRYSSGFKIVCYPNYY